jgi:glycosyltransferase involved in cell wall biosynthesis
MLAMLNHRGDPMPMLPLQHHRLRFRRPDLARLLLLGAQAAGAACLLAELGTVNEAVLSLVVAVGARAVCLPGDDGQVSTGPRVTVVIPTHDRHELLERAVRSALAQTVPDIEVIVVDDGSVKPVSLGRDDPRVRVIRHDRPLGVSAARNAGLRAARGRWITFTDDDDELLPNMVEVSLEAVERSTLPSPVSIISSVEVCDGRGRVIDVNLPTTVARQRPPYRGAPDDGFSQDVNTLFAPVDLLRSIGGWDEAIKGWEMDDLLIRLVQWGSIEGREQVTYRRFRHDGPRKSGNVAVALTGAESVLAKHRSFFSAHPQLYGRHLATLSNTYLRAGRRWPAVRAMARSLLVDPRRPKAVRQLVGTIIGPRLYGAYLDGRQRRAAR